ncbi:MAG: glycosyltransferase [Fischerella sp.]|nr:glycosyltransferase [Fischerella sp.]
MEKPNKPKLVFFQWKHEGAARFLLLQKQHHVKCLSEFFEVVVINDDCDYQEICDKYQPDLTLFESGVPTIPRKRPEIKNTSAYPQIPKLGLHNGDPFDPWRSGFISDMEHWGIETFFSIDTTTAEHAPEIAGNLFVWPNFIDSDMYRDYGESKIIPVLFTGHNGSLYPWRQRIHKIIPQYYPSLICPHLGYTDEKSTSRMIYGERYARTINASQIVPTCGTLVKEVVRKHFEIPACKSCLVTEKSPGLEAAGFIDMVNCVFADENNILDKLDYLFQQPDVLERITDAGYQLVHSRHTLKHRDQIWQWFKLYQNLKPNQKIVQTSPFEPLIVVEKSSGLKNSHIICNGLDMMLLKQGDEKLWAGKYEGAEAFYLRCLNYINYMPEPHFRLGLCNLYKGNAVAAHDWIIIPIKYTLNNYQALTPDPVEWSYLIISLLCQGKLDEAAQKAGEYPNLNHPELERTRWIINVLKKRGDQNTFLYNSDIKYNYSIHQLPERSFPDWVKHICMMLEACQEYQWAEILSQSLAVAKNHQELSFSPDVEKRLFPDKLSWKMPFFTKKTVINQYSKKIIRRIAYSFVIPLSQKIHPWEKRFGYFLPYNFSEKRNDEFFYKVHKIAKQEDIKTVLLIGYNPRQASNEAFLNGLRSNPHKLNLSCIKTKKGSKLGLQNCNLHHGDTSVNFYDLSNASQENFSENLQQLVLKIKQDQQIDFFDIIFIDGSELKFSVELDEAAKLIILEDINNYNNYRNYQRLVANINYAILDENLSLRRGYAIFQKLNQDKINI